MQFGVSYFGVRNPQHFQRDLEDIARLGFTSIIFTSPKRITASIRAVSPSLSGVRISRD